MRGDYRDAERQYRQLVTDRQHAQGDGHPQTLNARQQLARIRGLLGHYDDAEEQFRQLVDDDHPATMVAWDNLARVAGLQGRHREAEQLFRQVLAGRERIVGPEHPDTVATRRELAKIAASTDP
jgi:tetratricopeptide (TPR) repeat protein